jgi:hypothetical protein
MPVLNEDSDPLAPTFILPPQKVSMIEKLGSKGAEEKIKHLLYFGRMPGR